MARRREYQSGIEQYAWPDLEHLIDHSCGVVGDIRLRWRVAARLYVRHDSRYCGGYLFFVVHCDSRYVRYAEERYQDRASEESKNGKSGKGVGAVTVYSVAEF